ncbi:MAG: hypothetical protein H5T98_06535 [Syntrophomonadaceae bacterium]|nr:hypothetical protein [Syntrophomonadaceae bacterium]
MTPPKDKSLVQKLIGIIPDDGYTMEDVRREQNAFHPDVDDFEDELISVCAKRTKMDYIITRNTKNFTNSPVPAVTPEDFLTDFFEHL